MSIKSRNASLKPLSTILGGMFNPDNLPGEGFRRGFVLSIAEQYVNAIVQDKSMEQVESIAFRGQNELVIRVQNAGLANELSFSKEKLRQKINTRMKQEMIRRICIYSA